MHRFPFLLARRAFPAACALVVVAACGSSASSGGSDLPGTDGGVAPGAGGSTGGGTSGGGSGGDASTGGGGGGGGGGTGDGGSVPPAPGTSSAADVARKLGRAPNFLVGLGADDGQAWTFGAPLDVRYQYLSSGWETWNDPPGEYASITLKDADAHGTVPMLTLYELAGVGDGNTGGAGDPAFMGGVWAHAKLMFDKVAAFGKPVIVHLEPDWWGYTEMTSSGDPSKLHVQVKINAACKDLSDDVAGQAKCYVRMARTIAPKAILGFGYSTFGAFTASGQSDPVAIADYMKKIGAGTADIAVVETLDRDAGCFELHTDGDCQRDDGPWYWDETNQTSPNFHEHLAWVKTVHTRVGLPVLWWQMPLGRPGTAAGSDKHYRDNRVHYLFSHVQEFVDAGGLGAVFGAGAKGQTTVDTDGGQYRDAVNAYRKKPVALP